ncbi:hypothetical protein Pmar_PMAR018155 [Perkinsus marinus ATCC 50983]|uniref:Uncharacterized protein n=1 Tax=Perkinsus marinus (strain ATCC 50983 / TXsc) TaxID=423536 RepID=C5KFW9_PERM5|nr:hypothetical protein Pmar_PMAR009247 [Perkinsus marinus ATCC 50983]XP_002784821.1 hypothetical protein Pmar_PMAR018155 [Perkinsus marinus ATCC 50983]EEQ97548.1 hypothetical protein Pmar_PMAR009247 [Perkinsus marinus ATCC 50983]EER16617.1 hypothetical protein Pmar_PMAR018155 [Perkinsus marinus ATCC 50983]|eukprot:XP_002764831.1 hypothetical protein Pmar_PMAR009247 [Perkinsus marinus ATCC 50983]
MKIFFILALLLVLGVVNGDSHVDDTEKIFPGMMMNRRADNGGDQKSDFDQKQDSPNNLGDPFSCAACKTCKKINLRMPSLVTVIFKVARHSAAEDAS